MTEVAWNLSATEKFDVRSTFGAPTLLKLHNSSASTTSTASPPNGKEFPSKQCLRRYLGSIPTEKGEAKLRPQQSEFEIFLQRRFYGFKTKAPGKFYLLVQLLELHFGISTSYPVEKLSVNRPSQSVCRTHRLPAAEFGERAGIKE